MRETVPTQKLNMSAALSHLTGLCHSSYWRSVLKLYKVSIRLLIDSNNPKLLSQVSTIFTELTTLWCRCLPLSSSWRKQPLPNRSLVQMEKTRGDRSCPPGRGSRDPGRSLDRAGTSSVRKMEYALNFFLLRFLTVPITTKRSHQLFLGKLGFSSALLSVILLGM